MITTNLYHVDGQLVPVAFQTIELVDGHSDDYIIRFRCEPLNSVYPVWFNGVLSKLNQDIIKFFQECQTQNKHPVCKVDVVMKSNKNESVVLRAKRIIIDGFHSNAD